MKQFAFVNEQGLVGRVVSAGRDEDYTDGEYYDGLLAIEISVTEEPGIFLRTKYWKNETWQTKPEKPGEFYNWNLQAENWELDSTALQERLRFERDQKLYASDWTQIADAPLTPEQKTAWQTYRQALRDIPANNADITDLDQVVWPVKPT
jgi:hypothetical protein